MNIDKILVPTDFSAAARAALAYAVDLAERAGHHIVLLHVFPPAVSPLLDGAIISTPAQVAERQVTIDRRLDELCKEFERSGVALEGRALQGAASQEIVRFARDEGCALIVMGTHGRTGLRRLALGSIAEHVVRAATVPVLTLRGDDVEPATPFATPPL
jgi:nucleotide-binding universal stress UspA family protein